jgi:hypothetical protein
MNKKKNTKAPASSNKLDEALQLVAQATKAIGTVQRLTPMERKTSLKLRRGAHQVIPQITTVAAKYGISSPNTTSDMVNTSLARAQSLEPLLSAAALLHETLIDAHLGAQRDAWKGATALYGMATNAAKADVNIANELQTAREWFKQRRHGTVPATTSPTTTASTTTSATAQVATAAAPTSPASVTTSATAPATTTAH